MSSKTYFCCLKDTLKKMKSEPQIGCKYLWKYVSNKALVSRIYKEILIIIMTQQEKTHHKKTNNPIKKWANHSDRNISKDGL